MSARFSFSAAALLALAGCNAADRSPNEAAANGAQGSNSAAVNQTRPADPPGQGNEQQPASARLDEVDFTANAAAPAAADPRAVERDWFAGRWTDTGDCADAAHFAPNGTYLLANGTRGMWNVQDSRLIVQNAAGRATVRLRRVGDDEVETVGDDGSVGRSTRC